MKLVSIFTLALVALLPSWTVDGDAGAKALRTWLKDVQRGNLELDSDAFNSLRRILDSALSGARAQEEEVPHPLDEALLDLAAMGLGPHHRRSKSEPENPLSVKVRDAARRRLAQRMDASSDTFDWLARSVLQEKKEVVARRIAALQTLAVGRAEGALEPVLVTASVRKPAELRRAAINAMCGWPHSSITAFLFERTSFEEEGGAIELSMFTKHLEQVSSALSDEEEARILERVAGNLAADDWREAARALSVVRLLNTDEVYPTLIDALEAWSLRRGEKIASRRLETDLADELTRRTGRAMGTHPERWRSWWKLVQEGKVLPPDEEGERTEATFFSLRPSSDRVTFIIDRSGSMSAKFSPDTTRSRYSQAVEQTLNYLMISGEETLFNVILFSNEMLRYKPRLQVATERNREALERWLLYNGPEGGTHLREAVESALELRRDGDVDLGRLESDTVVVLCDGATYAGPDWVLPTLERVRDRAQVVFHCVQIGREGDGTLELLSSASGGDFIQISR